MIVHHGYKTIPVSKVKAPGDIEKIRKEPHTIALAESFGATGGKPASPIIVEWGTWRLLGGKHRFAAALNRKMKEVDALMIEGTQEELEQACLGEQVRRRRCTDAEIARLLELEHPTPPQTFPDLNDDESIEREDPTPPPVKRGRPSTGKKEAIEKVAKLTGRTPNAIKQADHRARHEADAEPLSPPASCIDTMGLHVPDEVHADAYAEAQVLGVVEAALTKLQGQLTKAGALWPQLYASLHEAAAIARSQMPASVCPHCKLLPALMPGCLACRKRGWLRAGEMASIPAPLLVQGATAGIYVNGKWSLLKDVQ